MINAIMGRDFNENTISTRVCSFETKRIKLKNNKIIILELWDTIGQKKFRSLSKLFLTDTDCFVLGFDLTNIESFNEIPFWYSSAKEKESSNLMYLIGNKVDLSYQRKISEKDALNLAKKYNLRYFEISCRTGSGIKEFVNDLANEIINH